MRSFRFLMLVSLHAILTSQPATALTSEQERCKKVDDAAIEVCTRLIGKPSSAELRSAYYQNRGLAWQAKGECDKAIADIQEAIRIMPAKTAANDIYYTFMLRLGLAFNKCKADQNSAIEIYDKLIQLRPHDAAAYQNRGTAWSSLKEFDKAIADQTTVISLKSATKEIKAVSFNNRAINRISKGELDRALEDQNQAIRLLPQSSFYSIRGDIWRLKGDLARAMLDHDKAIATNPKEKKILSHVYRGDTRRYSGDFSGAIADYESALVNSVDYVPALTGMGLTYERMGEPAKARSMFVRAIDSRSPIRNSPDSFEATETARARLAALDSGEAPPTIPTVAPKASNATSVPTQVAAAPKSLPPERVQATARQGRRVALVIGNSSYRHVAPLTNPENDADAIARSLRVIGFETVTLTSDATREKLIDALRTFANEAENSDWAMVYYAGHGIEVGGVNYLVPVDAKLAVDRDIEFEAVPLSQVLRATNAAKKIKLVMLDACRDNPFAPRKTDAPDAVTASESTAGRTIATRSTNGRGLAEVKVAGATLVVFAAKDGQVALDGEGKNSPFAVAVVQRLATPGVEINKLFRLVRDDVMEATAGRQEPYTYGSLPGKEDFFFVAK